MYKIYRGDCPHFLIEKAKEWTDFLIEKRKENKSYFYWHEYNKTPVNILLQNDLLTMTKNHCAFCDGFFEQSPVTVEHFKPVSNFVQEAYAWENLFPCCYKCQQKNNKYIDLYPYRYFLV